MPRTLTHSAWNSARAADLDSPLTRPVAPSAARSARSHTSMERFVCEACGDLIGVYEPLVMRSRASERTTSRAAEPQLRARDGAYFHRECHDSATG
jgi:hypothetical protein